MDFSVLQLDDDELAFRDEVRTFLDRHLTVDVIEHAQATGDGYHRGFHRALGKHGWVAPRWARDEGGASLDALRVRLLLSELWGRGAPDLLRATTILVADSLRPWISDDLRREIFPAVGRGEICLNQGITEPDAGSDAAAITTSAVRDGDEWVIRGTKMFSSHAHNADFCYLFTRTGAGPGKHDGFTVFLVPLHSPGIEIRPVQTLGHERTNLVYYDEVRVADRFRIGPVDRGWAVLNSQLHDEHGMGDAEDLRVGRIYGRMLERLLEAGVEEVLCQDWRAPSLGESSPLYRLGRVALDVELASVTPEPMGRVLVSEALIRDASDLLDLMGAPGLLCRREHGAIADGQMEWTHRAAQATAIYGGSTDIFRNIIAERLLGLPSHRTLLRERGLPDSRAREV